MTDFTSCSDLASFRLGARVVAANDEFFAEKENLLKPSAPEWREGEYTDRGKWMDGWETRRRRTPGHDWCIVRLAMPGIVRGVDIDTAYFAGNYPPEASLEGAVASAGDDVAALEWTEILPRRELAGDSHNLFDVESDEFWTHLRLNIYPDGGVARLRVFGEPVPECHAGRIDLASASLGARVLASSDEFFGSPEQLLLPDRCTHMGDGWETRRRRGPGNDWVEIALAGEGSLAEVVVDTAHFKGNAPGSCKVSGRLGEGAWTVVVPEAALRPNAEARFTELAATGPFDRLRLDIYPDGGVARLRAWGAFTEAGLVGRNLARLNAAPPASARTMLLAVCGSSAWAEAMIAGRPFRDLDHLFDDATGIWNRLDAAAWLQAFQAHPRIGERQPRGPDRAQRWSAEEQGDGTALPAELVYRMQRANEEYEEKFGHVFLIFATGKSVQEMLGALYERLENTPVEELDAAAAEQEKITALRLRKLLGLEGGP